MKGKARQSWNVYIGSIPSPLPASKWRDDGQFQGIGAWKLGDGPKGQKILQQTCLIPVTPM